MNKLTLIKIIALALLSISLFVPLLEAYTSEKDKALCLKEPRCEMPVAYAYKNIPAFAKLLITEPTDKYNWYGALCYFSIYFIPFISLLFKPKAQSLIILASSLPSIYFLHHFYTAYMPYAGTWLAIVAWVILLSMSLFTVWQHLPHNKVINYAPSAPDAATQRRL